MKILIAPWGWPESYKKATYSFEGNELPSNTSTGVLKKALSPDHTILILQDSLAVYNPEIFKLGTYKKLVQSLRNFLVEKFISKEEYLPNFNRDKDEVFISPNVGAFTNRDRNNPAKIIIKGKMSDYYYWIFYNLSRFIIDKSLDAEEVTLILDTSHGLNFMPYLTFSALYNIGAVLSLKFKNRLKLKIYNADPYIQESPNLEINLVRELYPKFQMTLKFKPQGFLPLKVNKNIVIQECLANLSKNIQNSFRKHKKLYKEIFLPFLGSFTQGIVHGILHFFPDDTQELEDNIFNLYNSKIQISREEQDCFLNIFRKLYFTDFFEAVVYVRNLRKIMESMEISNKKEANLKELRQWAEKLYEEFPVIYARTIDEIDNMKKILPKKAIPCGKWNPFGNCTNGISIHKRNFFAHAGLSENSIEIKKDNNDFQVRFCKHAISNILNYLKETVSQS